MNQDGRRSTLFFGLQLSTARKAQIVSKRWGPRVGLYRNHQARRVGRCCKTGKFEEETGVRPKMKGLNMLSESGNG